MGVSSSLRVSGCAILLGAMLQACSNLPQGQSEPEKAAASRSSPAGSTTASPPARPGSGTAAPQPGGPSSASAPPSAPAATAAAEPPPSALQVQLADGIRLFDHGEFYAAAGRLRNLPDLRSAPIQTQIKALKYLAFSYCVTNRRTVCQQQFEAVLKLDPKFELAPAERGHPIWKVVFERAKKAAGTPAKATDPKSPAKAADLKAPAKSADAKTPAKGAGAKVPANAGDAKKQSGTSPAQSPAKGAAKSGQQAASTPPPPQPEPPRITPQ